MARHARHVLVAGIIVFGHSIAHYGSMFATESVYELATLKSFNHIMKLIGMEE